MTNYAVSNLGRWFWYLIPANPILVRVVHSGSRRARHLVYRTAYLLILFAVFLFSFSTAGEMQGSLSEVAKISTSIFRGVAWVQLVMMCVLAPIFTAGAITQERDAETYNILLTTPLSNAQIVFGSLLSRLFFVVVLLLSGLPILCITMIYGGVTFNQIILSFAVAGATAVVAGSLAITISMIRVGTRRTIFSFYLLIALYMFAGFVLDWFTFTKVPEGPLSAEGNRRMSWVTPFHPFLSLNVGLSEVPAPSLSEVAHYGWPAKYLLAYPHISYTLMTLVASLVMITFGLLFVRRGANEGEVTWMSRLRARFTFSDPNPGQRRRSPKRVWSNPVAWREANTKAAASSGVTRYAVMAGGLIISAVILVWLINGWTMTREDGTATPFSEVDARRFLMWLIMLEFGLTLLVAANASASSMTRERESNTLDILLSTPLTSKYIVWGKLRGLISYTWPLLIVPLLNVLLFVVYDLCMLGRNRPVVVPPEVIAELAGILLVSTALACVIGLRTSLNSKKTVRALMVTIVIVGMVYGVLFIIGNAIAENAGDFGAALAPFTPFTAVSMMIHPEAYLNHVASGSVRLYQLVGTSIAVCAYGLAFWGLHESLVRNFDMTVRKQTAS